MRIQRLLAALTVVNLGLAMFLLAQICRVDAASGAAHSAEAGSPAPVLRGRTLEIVDDQGRVRASIKLHPADPNYKWPDGRTGIPETVMLRLIDAKGRPEVKLGASEQGAGLGLAGETDSTYVTLKSEGPDCSLKMTNKEGRQQMIKP